MSRIPRRDALRLGAVGLGLAAAGSAVSRAFCDVPDKTFGSGSAMPAGAARAVTVAFGSCSKPSLPQPLWSGVRALAPDAWLWLGDIVYADTHDISHTRSLYAAQKQRSDYAAVVASTRVLGIWDDHDFGQNDAGREYPERAESQQALLDFLDEPANSPRRKQAGIYASYELGSAPDTVKVILLDTRYHREPPGPSADTLGAAQWAWLEGELAASKARVNLIASGYQVLPLEHSYEKWGNFPRARRRLLELLGKTRAPGVIFLSGDRHFAELSRLRDAPTGYPLHELTSSGMTHSYERASEPNRYRIGALFPKLNFGVVRVDFAREEVTLEARGADGQAKLGTTFALNAIARARPAGRRVGR